MAAASTASIPAIAVASLVALASPAAAQSAPSWAGFYIGGTAGAAFGHSNNRTIVDCPVGGFNCAPAFPTTLINGVAIGNSGTLSFDDTSFTGGVVAGLNQQAGNVVYGLELDFGAFSLGGTATRNGRYPTDIVVGGTNYTLTTSVDTDWLFTARGRLGWSLSNLLLYGTGGLALTDLSISQTFLDTLASPTAGHGELSKSTIRVGWVLGAGAELAIAANWLLRAEYLHVDFGSVSGAMPTGIGSGFTLGTPGTGLHTISADLKADIVRGGIAYKF